MNSIASRVVYAFRFAYWLVRHRSWTSARWVMEYDGHTWPS